MHIPPQPAPGWRFNPPPGWPTPPDGWKPSAAWSGPDEDWPAPPPYWDWWVQDSAVAAPRPRRRLLLFSAAAIAAVAVAALALVQLTEPGQKTTVTPALASDTAVGSEPEVDAEPSVSPGPEDGGTYRDAREIMAKIEQAYGKTCDNVFYKPLNVNGVDLGEDTFAQCQLGLNYAKIHVFPTPVNNFAWQMVFSASMRGNYVILYGRNWIIDSTGADQFGLAAHEVLGGLTRVAR